MKGSLSTLLGTQTHTINVKGVSFIIYKRKGDDYMTDKMSRGLSVKVDVDVSEALTGLKALQREAKKTTQALREVESEYDLSVGSYLHAILTQLPTELLQLELSKREGVTTYEVAPHGANAKLTIDNVNSGQTVVIEGPAIVTVNID